MADLIIRPTGRGADDPWVLQLRRAGMPQTEYHTLARIDEATAREIVEAGAAFWLFGDPRGHDKELFDAT